MKTKMTKYIITTLILLVIGSQVFAAQYLFTGLNNSDWFDQSNWSTTLPYNGYPGSTTVAGDIIYYEAHLVIGDQLFNYATIKPTTAALSNPACSLEINMSQSFFSALENYGYISFKDGQHVSGVILNKTGGTLEYEGVTVVGTQQYIADVYNDIGANMYIGGTSTWDGFIDNQGFVGITPSAVMTITSDSMVNRNTGDFDNYGTVVFNGTFTNEGNMLNTGTMQGTGTINGPGNADNGNLTNSGILAVGLSPGELKFDCPYNQGPNSFYKCEIGGTIPGLEFDVLGGVGDKNLDGFLEITLYNNFSPSIGQSFTIVKGVINGTFSNVIFPTLASDRKWVLNYSANEVVLSIETNVPLSTKDINTNDVIAIYPNPATDVLSINNIGLKTPYSIYNVSGSLIQKGRTVNSQIDINRLSKGNYFLRILSKDAVQVVQFSK